MSAARRTFARQRIALARLPVTVKMTTTGSRLRWTAELQPTPLSRTYLIRITYAAGGLVPTVEVLRPSLFEDGVERLPHVWSKDRLCLCYPHEWTDQTLIAHTIVPWTSEWLLHFEVWKFTGKWHGGGHEPAVAPADIGEGE